MLESLNYQMSRYTLLDILNQLLFWIPLSPDPVQKIFLQSSLKYLLKMVLIDQALVSKYGKLELVAGVIKLCFEVMKKLDSSFEIFRLVNL